MDRSIRSVPMAAAVRVYTMAAAVNGVLRATWRFFTAIAWMAAVLTVYVASLVGRRADAGRAMRYARRWALGFNRITGLDVIVEGKVPQAGCMLVANHRSYTDIPAILSALPCTFVAKIEVSRWPVVGRGAHLTGAVFVAREDKDSRSAARNAIAGVVAKGLTVGVFSEGTTYQGPGTLPLRRGAFFMAAAQSVPVVPVAIEYASMKDAWVGDDTFVRHFFDRFRRRRMPVHVAFGPVLQSDSGDALRERAQGWIRANLKRPRREDTVVHTVEW